MRVLILFIVSRFGLCQDNIEASVDILKPHPELRSCTLPGEFTVTVRANNDSVTLQLVTSTSVKSTVPVYVYRQERGSPVIVRDTVLELERTGEYQDVTHLSNMEVSCVMKKINQPYYIFKGFLLFSGQRMFELKPTRSASGDIKYTLASSTVHMPQIDVDDDDENGRSESDRERMASHSLRKKRQIQSPIYVDVLAVIEFSVYKRWFARSTQPTQALKDQETKQGLRRHFAHLVNGVDLRYKAASPLYNINLVGYIIEDELSPKPFQNAIVNETKIEGNQLLKDISSWRTVTAGFPDNDHVVVFTALDLFDIDKAGNTTDLLGFAEIGAVCEYPEDSVSAVEYSDNLVDDMLVTTHEIGHALNALHDGDNNTCNSSYQYIMSGNGYSSTQVLDHNNYYVFSTCSLSYIQNFIQGILENGTDTQKECLQKPLESASVTNITGTMPGQLYDVHTQCQMMYGPGFFLRLDVDIGGPENICKRMACGKEEFEMFHSAVDGTPCGNKKWCVAGECVVSIDAPERTNPDCLYGNQPVVYPQNKTCDELISATPRLCYSSYYLLVCCQACLDNKRNDEKCLYGDRYVNCDTAITRNTSRLCYDEANADGCCETCSALASSLANCTYGDRSNCTAVTRENRNLCYNDNNAYVCCETCSRYVSGDANCAYGNRYSTCTDVTNQTRSLCYAEQNAKGCCETCAAYSSPIANCTYGNRLSDCSSLTKATDYLCYNEDVYLGCCETCSTFSTGGDCPYGDSTLTGPCEQTRCATSGSDYRKRCCDTCSSFTSQSSTTSTTPTTTQTTTASTTTSTTTTTTAPTPPTPVTRRESSSTTTTPLTTTPSTASAPPAATTGYPLSDFLTEPQKILIGASFALGLGVLIIIAIIFSVRRGLCGTKGKAPQTRTEDVDYTAPPLGVSSRGFSTYQPRF